MKQKGEEVEREEGDAENYSSPFFRPPFPEKVETRKRENEKGGKEKKTPHPSSVARRGQRLLW